MELKPLDKTDLELVEAAKATIQKYFDPLKHVASAAIRTEEARPSIWKRWWKGLLFARRRSPWGKQSRMGFVKFVAVYPPCGMCREVSAK